MMSVRHTDLFDVFTLRMASSTIREACPLRINTSGYGAYMLQIRVGTIPVAMIYFNGDPS